MLEEFIKLETEYLSTMPLDVVKAKRSNEKQNDQKLFQLTKSTEPKKRADSKTSKSGMSVRSGRSGRSGRSSRFTTSSRGSGRSRRDKHESADTQKDRSVGISSRSSTDALVTYDQKQLENKVNDGYKSSENSVEPRHQQDRSGSEENKSREEKKDVSPIQLKQKLPAIDRSEAHQLKPQTGIQRVLNY